MNRLVLNLRREGSIIDDTVPSLAMPSFARLNDSILGNIGTPLRDGTESDDDEAHVPSER